MSEDAHRTARTDRRHIHARTYHGPVGVCPRETSIQVVTFTGSEEADILHSAGMWMGEHRDATLIGVNWVGGFLFPHDSDPLGPPLHCLDLTVDLSNERH